MMSLADFGVETLIQYRMYAAFASEDKNEICKLMSLYRKIYLYVGLFILIVGIFLTPFLRFIIKDQSLQWEYIYVVYAIQMLSTLCTYFLAYRRILFIVDQCEYKCTKVDAACSLGSYFLQIIVLLTIKSYILYLLIKVVMNIVANCFLAFRTKREYPYVDSSMQTTRKDIEKAGIWHDIKNNMVQKVASLVWSSTDNILISMLLGISSVGVMANYTLITGYITSILNKIMDAFQASIGNMIYTNDTKHGNAMFHMFDMVEFFMASFVACAYFVLINPLISLWLGTEFTVGMGYVLVLSMNQYVMWNHRFINYYRNAFGKYEEDRNYILAGAILNIVCSVILAKPFGLAGIMAGTVIGHVGFWFGRVKVIYKEYVTESVRYYVLRQIRNVIILAVEMILLWSACKGLPQNFLGFAGKIGLCIFIPNIINLLIFSWTKDMKLALVYMKQIWQIIRRRFWKR